MYYCHVRFYRLLVSYNYHVLSLICLSSINVKTFYLAGSNSAHMFTYCKVLTLPKLIKEVLAFRYERREVFVLHKCSLVVNMRVKSCVLYENIYFSFWYYKTKTLPTRLELHRKLLVVTSFTFPSIMISPKMFWIMKV